MTRDSNFNNRLWNSNNPNQGHRTRVLVVCSAGLLRSPTVAWILGNEPFNMNARAAGSTPTFALIPVDEVLLNWAQTIVFVNDENFKETEKNFPVFMEDVDQEKTIIVLDLPDRFQTFSPELVEIATAQLNQAFEALENG